MRKQRSRWVTALALAAILAGPVASARAAEEARGGQGLRQLAAGLRSWVESIFPWEVLTEAACDDGSMIDPNGRCHTAAVVVETACDKGPAVDPNGGCLPAVSRPAGGGR